MIANWKLQVNLSTELIWLMDRKVFTAPPPSPKQNGLATPLSIHPSLQPNGTMILYAHPYIRIGGFKDEIKLKKCTRLTILICYRASYLPSPGFPFGFNSPEQKEGELVRI